MDTNELVDVERWPEILIPDHNILRMMANCYVLCHTYFHALSNARRGDAAWNTYYRACRLRFATMLRRDRDPHVPVQHTAIATLRRALRSQDQPEALAHCAALLRALSDYIAGEHNLSRLLEPPIVLTPSAALERRNIMISARTPSPIAQSMPRLPRRESAISDMLERYHPGVHLTPVTVDRWRLLACPLPVATARLLATRVRQHQLKIAVSPLTDLSCTSPGAPLSRVS